MNVVSIPIFEYGHAIEAKAKSSAVPTAFRIDPRRERTTAKNASTAKAAMIGEYSQAA
jgi:hypothetical protein